MRFIDNFCSIFPPNEIIKKIFSYSFSRSSRFIIPFFRWNCFCCYCFHVTSANWFLFSFLIISGTWFKVWLGFCGKHSSFIHESPSTCMEVKWKEHFVLTCAFSYNFYVSWCFMDFFHHSRAKICVERRNNWRSFKLSEFRAPSSMFADVLMQPCLDSCNLLAVFAHTTDQNFYASEANIHDIVLDDRRKLRGN